LEPYDQPGNPEAFTAHVYPLPSRTRPLLRRLAVVLDLQR
jgi:hypothetical protein